MKVDENTYEEMFAELDTREKKGVCIMMEEDPASPLQVVAAHMVKETGTYMRDYVLNPAGNVEILIFHKIKGNC